MLEDVWTSPFLLPTHPHLSSVSLPFLYGGSEPPLLVGRRMGVWSVAGLWKAGLCLSL